MDATIQSIQEHRKKKMQAYRKRKTGNFEEFSKGKGKFKGFRYRQNRNRNRVVIFQIFPDFQRVNCRLLEWWRIIFCVRAGAPARRLRRHFRFCRFGIAAAFRLLLTATTTGCFGQFRRFRQFARAIAIGTRTETRLRHKDVHQDRHRHDETDSVSL